MSGTAQIFPVVGSNVSLPVPLPTQDVSDGTPSSAAPTKAIQVGGTDGTNLRAILTDALGRIEAVGAAASGALVGGNPVYVAGFDGTYTQGLYTDSMGQLRVLIENSVIVGNSVTVLQARVPQAPAAPGSATVTGSSSQVVAANAARTGLMLTNTSGDTISIGFGNAAVLFRGVTLQPSGGTFRMDGYTFTTDAVDAISSGTASNLGIQEFS
jgi:hypothetical protein